MSPNSGLDWGSCRDSSCHGVYSGRRVREPIIMRQQEAGISIGTSRRGSLTSHHCPCLSSKEGLFMTGRLSIWEDREVASQSYGISTMAGVPTPSDIMAPSLTTSSSSSSRSSLSLSSGLMPSPRGPSPSSPAPRKKWAVALSPSLAGSDHIPAGAPAHPALKWRGSPLAQNPSPMVVGGDGGWGMRK